jgi:glycogen debranching enzyme
MAEILGRENDVGSIKDELPKLTDLINNKLWDPETSFYYDMWKNGQLNGVKSVGSYWALLADIVPEDRIAPFIAHLNDEKSFNRPHRVPSLAADQEGYDPGGSYWKGSVWAPTTYMVLKGLEEIKNYDLAYEIARNHHDNVVNVYKNTGTLWENYAPEQITQGNMSQPYFVGWSGQA